MESHALILYGYFTSPIPEGPDGQTAKATGVEKILLQKSNIIQISQALHFNISGIMLVFL